jgi:NTP pyrophosphatase (non-canonical NTP hydrolase)
MNKITYEERKAVYDAALGKWGAKMQATVAIEEMSEVIKEITKMLRGELDREHMAEEIADATIMLEQLRQMLNINDSVCSWMDYKVAELKRRVEKCG